MTTTNLNPKFPAVAPGPSIKSKRVRTGCLTCRERHLKCDESLPHCMNCRKGSRVCKRGIRLNFLDTQVHTPLHMPRSRSWTVKFHDESRQIASEYRGGPQRYALIEKSAKSRQKVKVEEAFSPQKALYDCVPLPLSPAGPQAHPLLHDSPAMKYSRAMSSPSSMAKSYPESRLSSPTQVRTAGWTDSTEDSNYMVFPNPALYARYLDWQYDGPTQPEKEPRLDNRAGEPQDLVCTAGLMKGIKESGRPVHYVSSRDHRACFKRAEEDRDDPNLALTSRPITGEREFLRTADEVQYMQVFVEEVAVWMDSFDKEKHFSHFIPYRALKSPMLLNSLLACGVRHLSMCDSGKVHTAQFYYNTATTQLLRNLENPERDTAECAAAAVILKVCELMSKKTSRKMSHVSSTRALMIRDCGWDANSTGVGSACFWLNIYLEVLSSLESDCAVSWPPNEWGLDGNWMNDNSRDEGTRIGEEELWIQRMIYILARVADFQAFVSVFVGNELSEEKIRLEYRLPEWRTLKHLCDSWNDTCPKTMHPLGYLNREQTCSASLFPKVWLPKREAVLGRLLYHTAQCILTQTHPMEQTLVSEEMRALQIHHAHEVCGIVAHTKEGQGGGLAFLSVQSLIIASKVLIDHGEQTEVLKILRRMHTDSGWGSEDVERALKATWGWDTAHPLHGHDGEEHFRFKTETTAQANIADHPAARLVHDPEEVIGLPMPHMEDPTEKQHHFLNTPGFHESRHPYQGWYEPPSQANSISAWLNSSYH